MGQDRSESPQSLDNHYLIQGAKLVDENNYEQAAIVLMNVIKTEPNNPMANYLLGRSYYFLENYSESIRHLNTYLQFESIYTDAYLYRGLSFYNTSQKKEAATDLKRFLKLSSDPALTSIAKRYLRNAGYGNDDIRISITNTSPNFNDVNLYVEEVASTFGDDNYSKFEGMWEIGFVWNHKYWEKTWISYEFSIFSGYAEVENTISNPPDDYIEMTIDGFGLSIGPQFEIGDFSFLSFLGELKGGYNIILFSRELDRNNDSFTTSTFSLNPSFIIQFGPRKYSGRILGLSFGYEIAEAKNNLFNIDLSRSKIEFDLSISLFF